MFKSISQLVCLGTWTAVLSSCSEPALRPDFKSQSSQSPASMEGVKSTGAADAENEAGTGTEKPPVIGSGNANGKDPAVPSTGSGTVPNTSAPEPPLDNGPIAVSGPTGAGCVKWESLKSPLDVACAGSVENVFAKMPAWLGENFVLMKASNSNQTATKTNPRVIVYDPTTNFIVAASSQPDSKKVEIAVFDQVNEEWKFGEVDFTDPKFPKLETKICAQCHGSFFRLIWSDYPVWKGTVGIADSFETFNQSRDQKLTTNDAIFLNAASSGSPTIPAIVRSLTFDRAGSYEAGTTFRTSSGNLNNESSQGLNFTANYKNARILAGKLMRDPKVTRAQKLGIFKEMLCVAQFSEKYTTLNTTPYPADVYMNHGIATERANVNGWDALEQESFHFAAELFRRYWESDAALKAQLPDAGPLFQAVAYKSLINTSVTEGLKYRNTEKSDMYRPSIYAIDVLRPYFAPGGKACIAIKGLQ